MFTALFTIVKKVEAHKSPSGEEWISKFWHSHTMEYYSAVNGTDTHYNNVGETQK